MTVDRQRAKCARQDGKKEHTVRSKHDKEMGIKCLWWNSSKKGGGMFQHLPAGDNNTLDFSSVRSSWVSKQNQATNWEKLI